MRPIIQCSVILLIALAISPAFAQEKKAKPQKVTGNVGLIDTEKNYMIVVTKEGKLVTVNFNDKTKVTKYVPQKATIDELDLGTAVNVTYGVKVGELEGFEYKVKAKKGE